MAKEHVGEDGRCKHCLGMTDADGFAPLGEAEEFENFEGSDTDQHEATGRLHESGFADAMKSRGYAEGGEVEQPKSADQMLDAAIGPSEAAKAAMAEMKRRKAERYGKGAQ